MRSIFSSLIACGSGAFLRGQVKRSAPKGLPAAIAVIGGAVLASGCSGLSARLDSPEPEQIIQYTKAFEVHLGKRISTGEDYVRAGYNYVDHYCEQFFIELEVEKRNLLFARNSVQQAFATAPAILTATYGKGSPDLAKPLAILAALAGLSAQLFDSYGQQFTFASYSTQLRLKVQEAQHNYKTATETALSSYNHPLAESSISDAYKAHQLVQGYARLCTIPQFEQFIVTALDATRAGKGSEPTLLRCMSKCDPHVGNETALRACMQTCIAELGPGAQKVSTNDVVQFLEFDDEAGGTRKKAKKKSRSSDTFISDQPVAPKATTIIVPPAVSVPR